MMIAGQASVSAKNDARESPATDADVAALELRGVTKRYGRAVAVENMDLVVRRGEFLTLLGPSGSGKTSILRLVAGFLPPTSGLILVNGQDVSLLPPGKRGIGLVFQNYALFPHLTVEGNIRYPLTVRRWSKSAAAERVREVLDLTRLTGYEQRRPHELSGGQQQRVALARALSFKPAFLLMDEPLGALDRVLRIQMQQEIREIHRLSEATVIFVTHDREEALAMSTRIAVLRDGRILQIGGVEEVFAQPSDTFVAELVGDANLWPVSDLKALDGGLTRLRLLDWEMTVAGHSGVAERETRVLLRPSRFRIATSADPHVISGRITDRQYQGETIRLILDVPGLGSVKAAIDARDCTDRDLGDQLELAFSPEDLFCLPYTTAEAGTEASA